MRKPTTRPKPRKRRPGAGRKPLGKKKATFALRPETIELIKQRAAKAGIPKSHYVEQAVLNFGL
jgi:Ribbon-helix-helix domain